MHDSLSEPQAQSAAQKHCVLIDDDPTYRLIMQRCAEVEGIKLDVFESLEEMGSVGLLKAYDVAIVDYDLGKMTGIEIGEYLTRLIKDVPMVLLSAKDRYPDQPWPESIKCFINKQEGYAYVLERARQLIKAPDPRQPRYPE